MLEAVTYQGMLRDINNNQVKESPPPSLAQR